MASLTTMCQTEVRRSLRLSRNTWSSVSASKRYGRSQSAIVQSNRAGVAARIWRVLMLRCGEGYVGVNRVRVQVQRRGRQRGFTLLELLVVLVIIGMLAAIV